MKHENLTRYCRLSAFIVSNTYKLHHTAKSSTLYGEFTNHERNFGERDR
jgi:hypothetical protein